MIKNTLPKDARDFVKLDSEGNIDKALLAKYENKEKSTNFSTLLSMVNDKEVILVNVAKGDKYDIAKFKDSKGKDKYPRKRVDGEYLEIKESISVNDPSDDTHSSADKDYNPTTNERAPLFGIMLSKDLSASGKREVVINGKMTMATMIEVISHELYCHAGGKYNGLTNTKHKFDLKNKKDTNQALKKAIITAVQEAIKNYNNGN